MYQLDRPIATEQAYDAALARIGELVGARKGTAAAGELSKLVALVNAYEAMRRKTDAPGAGTVACSRAKAEGRAAGEDIALAEKVLRDNAEALRALAKG